MSKSSPTITGSSILVEFDADAVLETVRAMAGDTIGVCVEYNTRSFNILYLEESLENRFEDLDELYEVGEDLHTTLFIDFTEQKLLNDFHPVLGEMRASVTYMSGLTMIRVIQEDEGLFLTIEPDAQVTPVIEAIEAALDGADHR